MRIGRWLTRRDLIEGECIPLGWGYCRPQLYSADRCYIAPIPLNFIFGASHWFYWRVLVHGFGYKGGGYEAQRRYWIMEGERRGYAQGYEAGINHTLALAYRQDLAEAFAEATTQSRSVTVSVEGRPHRDSRSRDGDQGNATARSPVTPNSCCSGSCGLPCSGAGEVSERL